MALIKCKDLAVGYATNIIKSNINFEVNTGDYLCIVGENGAGKSTLMKTILSLIPPVGGKIEFGDGLKQNEIGYLPQQTVVQRDFPACVSEIVLSGCINKKGFLPFYSKQDKEKAKKNIERMNISNLTKKCYRELSGGQQQRVLLARALCATQRLLLLDEPVSGLDPKATQDMYNVIKQLNEQGIAIIMISHDLHSAIEYSNKILNFEKDIFFGNTKDYAESIGFGGEKNA